jgi:hypothetical protein
MDEGGLSRMSLSESFSAHNAVIALSSSLSSEFTAPPTALSWARLTNFLARVRFSLDSVVLIVYVF